jgi:pimeloyl-ACP methyl ester carboxylesterase
VILLPGFGASAFTYRHQLPALGAADFRATAVDLKGHGFSDKPTGRGEYTFDAMYRHVEDVVEAIARGPTIVVAQSMAGALAFELALSRGVLLRPIGNTVYFMPPYVITDDEVAWSLDQIRDVLEDISRVHSVRL